MSKLIADEFGCREATRAFVLALVAIVLANMFILLSGSTVPAGGNNPSDPWWNENWAKRRPVTINNSNNSNTLENYQVRVVVAYDNDMLTNFDDLRFCDNDEVTELRYWIENYNNGENAAVWVKVPSIPANDNRTIYMYYGNPGAKTESDGSAVFNFFDNFDNATKFSTENYPYGDPRVAAYPNFVEFGNNGNEEYIKLGCYDEGELRKDLNLLSSNYKIFVKWRTANDPFEYDNADYTNYDGEYGASTLTPKRLIVVNENKIYEKDGKLLSYSEKTEVSYTGAIDNFYLSVGSSGSDIAYYMYYDLAFIRKFTDPEPVTSVGEEESNTVPSAPNLLEPENNVYENDPTPLFKWENSIDPEGDSIKYTLQIDNEVSFSAPLVYEKTGITENQHELPAENALSDGVYYWRVGARDMVNPDNWAESFTLTIDTVAPSAPTLVSPEDNAVGSDLIQAFTWTEPELGVTYDIQIDNETSFTSPYVHENTGLTENFYSYTFASNGTYYWRVRGRDVANNYGPWTDNFKLIIQAPPSQPTLYLPANGTIDNDNTPNFEWIIRGNTDNHRLLVDNDPDFSSPTDNILLGATDNTWTKPSPGYMDGTYYWRVVAISAGGENGSDNWNFVIDTSPPSAPTLLEPDNNVYENDSTPTFRWSEPEIPEKYTLVIDNDADFGSPTQSITDIIDNTFMLTTPLPDDIYYWRVREVDAAGNQGAWSESFTLTIDTVAPPAPTLVSPEDNTVGSDLTQAFTWTKPELGLTYDIQIDNEISFTSPYVHENTGLSENSYSYAFASNGTYYWRVRAKDMANNYGPWADNFKLIIQAPPGQPTLYLPANGTISNDNTPYFEWIIGGNANNHQLLVDNDLDFSSPIDNIILGATDNTWTKPSPGYADDTYYWRVVAISAGGENGSDNWSFVIDTLPPSAPTLLELENNVYENDSTPTFRWSEPEIPENYTLVIDNDADFGSPTQSITDITDNTFTLITALPDDIYYWRVREVDAAGNQGTWSESFTLSVDTVAPVGPTLQSPADGTITNDNTSTFVWDEVIDPSGLTYDLQVDNDSNFSSPEVDQTGLADNTYMLTTELVDENYSWRVRAVDGAGNVGEWSVVWTILIDTISPGSPTLVSPENGAAVSAPDVMFSWSEPEPGVAYHVQIDNETSFTSPHVHENSSIINNSYTYKFALVGTYYWRVRARDKAGNWSEWSDNFKLTIEVAVPPWTPHDPIYIENDDFFNIGNGVVAGTGAGNDPYIIENWAIEASTAHGIWIKNTTAYFIVRNCLVENGGLDYYHGIYLENVVNGRVENCVCGNNLYGIYLRDSPDNNSITNNICENNYHSIYLCYSSNNTIINNICENNAWYGIALYPYASNNTLDNNTCSNNLYGIYLRFWSDNNTVVNNTCWNNAYGICLSSSDNNTLDNNTCSNNFRGIYLDSSGNIKMRNGTLLNNQYNFGVTGTTNSHFVHDIDPSNLVNGEPIRYLVDNRDEVIAPSLGIGYLALVNCDNIRVENLALGNNDQGILLTSTWNSLVRNCTFENNFCGIRLYSSDNNLIYHNIFENNENQAYDDGTNHWDNGYPSGGNYWSNYTGEDNYRGENQDIPGSDGIGDTPYYILGDSNVDRYPLMNSGPLSVSISISPSYQSSPPGAMLTYVVKITNTGIVDCTYNLTVIDNAGWGPMLYENRFENVTPREENSTTLTVTIPDNENLIGVEDNITVIATSEEDVVLSDNDSCIAHVVIVRSVKVTISPVENSGSLGETLTYAVVVSNTGNVPDNYSLENSDNAGWVLMLDNDLLMIPADENRETALTVTIPDNAETSAADVITVTATSQTDNTVSDNDSCIARAILENAFTLDLENGWNLVGFVVEDTPNNVFTGLNYYTDYFIYYWNAPGGPYGLQGPDQVLEDNLGYWIWINQDNTVTTRGTPPDNRDIYMENGWNLVSFPVVNENTTPNNVFTGLNYYTDYFIYYWNAPGGPYGLQGPDQVLEDNLGYWIWINQDKTVTVP